MGKSEFHFEDDTVVVTGATSGIGRETALQFADAGATVINADVEQEPKDADVPTHEAIENAGGTAEYLEVDVTDPAQIEAAVDHARNYGGVDVMVNNAGLYIEGPMREITPEQFDRIHAVNAKGVFFGCQAAANDMIERDDPGVIVNTASISSNLAQFDQVQYDSTKGAVRMITRGTALEFAEHDIRVNAVAPGQIATEFAEGWSDEAVDAVENEELVKPVPLGRAGFPEDVAGAMLFLASDDAAYITGELLHVDGGWQIF
ncbi:SDR family NAD(P)-dependent oxidoreductase [Halomicrococcus sp. SG-WS-1]|uniref:SDR family NAD(P)-dependent oxidoreductase n=1 Tax=Halomicrococcus sp. SG-WS-1 TaxID=3439057 RepID=UPI003F7967A7